MKLARGLTLFALVVVGPSSLGTSCGAIHAAPDRGPEASAWSYRFVLDESLTRLEAHVCFEGEMPRELAPIDRSGRRYLRSAEGPDGRELPRVGRAIEMRHLPPDSCVRYVVDLDTAARQRGGLHGAYRIGDDLVASTAVWLWAPRHRARDANVSARFELPDGIRISPLWTLELDGSRRLDERAFRFTAYSAFGRFETRHVGVPGACMRVTVLGDGVDMGDDGVVRSLSVSAEAASMIFGRFPVPEVGVLAVPTPFSESSPFGIVGRGTMPTVAILIGERATEERLTAAWVPVHEFSHLATPFIDRQAAWLSEGIATYYQEVLRARGGIQPPETTWRNLESGFRRGERSGTGRSLRRESQDMLETAAFRRVYWAGAAIALIADVEIRSRSNHTLSLDDALLSLSQRRTAMGEPMTADDAIRALSRVGSGAFGDIARSHLGSADFPDLSETYRRLDGDVTLRDAITSPVGELEAAPDCQPRR